CVARVRSFGRRYRSAVLAATVLRVRYRGVARSRGGVLSRDRADAVGDARNFCARFAARARDWRMSVPSVSVAIVSYNRRDQVKSLMESVYRGDLVPDEIIVVDNASSDGTADMLAREFPAVRVIANHENYMGSHAVNQGIAAARSDFVYATA